jgi:hypothetical protein
VRTEHVDKLSSLAKLKTHNELVIGAYDNPFLRFLISEHFPNNPVKSINSYDELTLHQDIDFVIWSFEKAVAFAYTNPGFTVVVNEDVGTKLLFAYYMSEDNDALKEYINYWIDIQNTNGFFDEQKRYWFKRKTYEALKP